MQIDMIIIKNSTQIIGNLWEQAVITADTPAVPLAEPIIQGIVGHTRVGMTQEVYFRDGYTLVQLKQAIEKFSI